MAKEAVNFACKPNPKQEQFFMATAKHVGYGGARGGGKSWAMRKKFSLLALDKPGLKLLLLRRTFAELDGNHIKPLQDELSRIATYNSTNREFRFPNGSFIKLGYCDTDADIAQYMGQEYDVIGFEEATLFTEYQMTMIATCCRNTRTDFKPRMYYTCNPGGPGHHYIKRLFIDRNFKDTENPDDYVFIQALVTDNDVLMQNNPEYINTLKAMPEDLRRAHLEGDWNVIAGQYFQEFRTDTHVIKPFEIPAWWRRFRAMDWGYRDPTAVLWFAISPDKHLYVYRELYESELLATDAANRIKGLSGSENISYTVASPDMWQKRGVKDAMGGESIAETFMQLGVPLMKADNARIIGWQRLRENLAMAADKKPVLQIFSTCPNLIRTLPNLFYDEHNHEDVSDACEDHAPEALRYGVMSRPSPAKEPVQRQKARRFDPFSIDRKPSAGGFFNL